MPAQGTDDITAHITGDISGQVALGSSIRQRQDVGGSGALRAPDLDAVRAVLTALRLDVARDAPADLREGAIERLHELERAVLGEGPDLRTISYVTRWFARRAPDLGRLVAAAYANPSVARVLEEAKSGLAGELRASLGS